MKSFTLFTSSFESQIKGKDDEQVAIKAVTQIAERFTSLARFLEEVESAVIKGRSGYVFIDLDHDDLVEIFKCVQKGG